MPTIAEALRRIGSESETDPVPRPSSRQAPVLIEAARDDELLLPKPGQAEQPRFMTQRRAVNDMQATVADRHAQLTALQTLVSDSSQIFELVKRGENPSPNIVIGRARRSDVMLIDPTISSVHAVVEMRDAVPYVSDHRSRNGTFVNREPVKPTDQVALRSGDCVRFGDRVFYYLSGDRLALFLDMRASGGG